MKFKTVLFVLNCYCFTAFSLGIEAVDMNESLLDNNTVLNISNSSYSNETDIISSEVPIKKVVEDDASSFEVDHNACTCNLIEGICEASCCCDRKDCTDKELKSFKNCEKDVFSSDEKFCFTSDIFFKSQFDFVDIKSNKKCVIVEDFIKQKNEIYEPIILSEEFELLKLTPIKYLPSYNKTVKPIHVKLANEDYRKTAFLGFPHSVSITDFCTGLQPIVFLKDEDHSCFQKLVENSNQDCHTNLALKASSYYKDLEIVTDIRVASKDKNGQQTSDNYTTTDIKPFLCKENFEALENCVEIAIPSPKKNEEFCENVVSEVLYNFIHSGIKGIHSANAYFILKNLTIADDKVVSFQQHFKVIHTWKTKTSLSNVTNKAVPVANSLKVNDKKAKTLHKNRVGYLLEQTVSVAMYNNDIEALSQNSSKFLAIPKANVNGNCEPTLQMPILFGENVWSGCKLNVVSSSLEEHCEFLMKNACSLLKSFPFPSHLGSSVNSNPDVVSDWVPVFKTVDILCEQKTKTLINKEKNLCQNIIFSPHMNIFYALVGSKAKPRAKIVNVILQNLKSSERIFMNYKSNFTFEQSFLLMFSVSFTDITEA